MKFQEHFTKDWSEDSVRLIATPSSTAKSTFFFIQEVGEFKTLKHYYTERSGLSSYLIIYTLAGKGHLNYRGKKHTISKGQLMFINCMELHYYETDHNELWEFLWVHFNGSTSKGYYNIFNEHQDPVVTVDQDTLIPTYIRSMIDLHKKKHLQREVLCSNLLLNCLTEILSTANTYTDAPQLPNSIKTIQDYLDHHYYESITLDQLAKDFGISKYHLIRQYKRNTGFTITDYIISLRISHAKQLLQFSNLSIQAISYEVGIENVSHFIKLFKKREDVTPFQFRKRWSS